VNSDTGRERDGVEEFCSRMPPGYIIVDTIHTMVYGTFDTFRVGWVI
jgi:hypothetical protein